MTLDPHQINQYYVFLASPGDVNSERQHVRQFFERYNRYTAQLWDVRFEVVDWENYSTIGVGRPQELITKQTLEKYRQSLALVIGIMNQKFGSPTGKAESGTEEEFNWAMESHKKHGFPEIKWFFSKIDKLEMPTDPKQAREAIEQWEKVLAFRRRMQDLKNPVFYTEYPGPAGFRDVFENDLNRWLADASRPWITERAATTKITKTTLLPQSKYYDNIERDFHRLDIAGIDNNRTFEIPLSEIYVRLRVMFDEDAPEETEDYEGGPIDIQTALLRYPKLVIVGDPGSGKSTFLKYIALMLARSFKTGNPSIALEKLCLPEPLPVPIFLSCWDLADFLKQRKQARLNMLVEFVAERLAAYDFPLSTDDVESLLDSGNCCLLFDGLDEVPTDRGRAAVSRLLEDCVAQYDNNRFVVTSRIRAYTGDTILKGEFTRCDIQPFDVNDRAEFIRNWVALLFRVPPEDVVKEGSEAGIEFDSLTSGIEENDRIRPLAVNPLLLTVIAIVHWNRKRLPEQRVDLYDECVDVLLGQRKEAEHIQITRRVAAMDEQREEQTHEERAWVRKRFAEIALHILGQSDDRDEATKADVVKLLVPRFIDRGAATQEQAAARAELFLERQELRSGLLVSRRANSYRFVHLTFQEYLAAWQLSNMDFNRVSRIIRSRLRQAKWFEALQLLGGQWAKDSDEKADRFVAWLLDNRGSTISAQAPVVALCANIVRDISGVAELKTQTRNAFKVAVEATLDAFREGSGVDVKPQLEILEALGQLGAAVKSHLIDATKAALFPVRRRAIEMLLPHLSDDELFGLDHILEDRSKEPIKAYLSALVECDPSRIKRFFALKKRLSSKAAEAIIERRYQLQPLSNAIVEEAKRIYRPILEKQICEGDVYARGKRIKKLSEIWPDKQSRILIEKRAVHDKYPVPRSSALNMLSNIWPDEKTRKLLLERAVQDENEYPRTTALRALAKNWSDADTQRFIEERAVQDESGHNRYLALIELARNWPDNRTRNLLKERAIQDKYEYARVAALRGLAENWPDDTTRKMLEAHAVQDRDEYPRFVALRELAKNWPDKSTLRLLEAQVTSFHDVWCRFEIKKGGALLQKKLRAEKWESRLKK